MATNRTETKPKGTLVKNERLLLQHIDRVLFVQESRMIARAALARHDCGLQPHQCEDCAFLRVEL